MNVADILAPVAEDMSAVNRLIAARLRSEVVLINQMAAYIVNSGGKRLRPLLALLSARACGYRGERHIQLATIIEFIHTATLLHDDVVDGSDLRRGQQTANAVWGNSASVLVGDFLYSRAFEMMVELNDLRVLEILAHTTNVIAEGEVLQLLNVHNPETSEQQYLRVIRSKTAKLFEAGARLGAIIAGQSERMQASLAAYGMHLGTAFQLIDDVLDYNADPEEIGKNIGDDLAEGKPTLPLIYVLEHGNPAQTACVRSAIEDGGRDRIAEVLEAIQATGALQYTRKVAQAEAEQAIMSLAGLGVSPYRDSLRQLAEFSTNRTH
ncbi:MAG TPA: octaprenyl diphosphate synthase [Gammaproteobacteria bacterium]|nr:octaprenyl diphosphate synthase [Gammaproteobacteria bacterium]